MIYMQTTLQPRIRALQYVSPAQQQKRRVAAYARVSTDSEEQLTSYAAQVNFYTQYIQNHGEWEFVSVYTDEGISATSTKNRGGFNNMVQDAIDGKIDLIITKSVSRFARNTVDSLNTIRELKAHGVEVFFERENIYTFDGKGELMLTIMSSLAQEESRSISENVKWGQRKRAAEGKVTMPYARFLGYEKGRDAKPQIVEKEAETVRLIYSLYLQGKSLNTIAAHLTDIGTLTPAGKKRWNVSTINSILQNEKYKGDALLQKTYVDDFLTKKIKKNNGEVQQYYVEDSHPAIISPETFDMVQTEMSRRRGNSKQSNGAGCFSSRIICGDCGGFYGSKVWHSTTQYKRTIWRCNNKYGGDKKCGTPHIYEDRLKSAFVEAFNSIVGNYDAVRQEIADVATGTAELEAKLSDLRAELDIVGGLIQKCVVENARVPQDQDDYTQRYNALTARYGDIDEKIKTMTANRDKRAVLHDAAFSLPVIDDFDEAVWRSVVDHVTVDADGCMAVTFKDGKVAKIS